MPDLPNLTIDDAAQILGVSTKTLRRWEQMGRITPVRTPGGQRRYSLNSLQGIHNDQAPNPKSQIQHQTPTSNFHLHELSRPLIAPIQKKVIGYVLTILVLAGTGTVIAKNTNLLSKFTSPLPPLLNSVEGNATGEIGTVLAAETIADDFRFTVNIPALFNKNLTAPNVIYSLTAGKGITISSGQTPTISATNELTAGTGIKIEDDKVTNTDLGSEQKIFKTIKVGGDSFSAGSNTDTLTFAAGDNITLSANTGDKKLTITAAGLTTSSTPSIGGITVANLNTPGGVVYASAAGALAVTSLGTTGQVLVSGGSGTPTWVSQSSLGTTNYWQRSGAILTPLTASDDLNISGNTVLAPDKSGATALTLRASSVVPSNILYVTNSSATTSYFTIGSAGSITLPQVICSSGTNGGKLTTDANGTIICGNDVNGGDGSLWQNNLGAISPNGVTSDILVGGNATSSALFRINGTTGNITLPNSNLLTGLPAHVQFSNGISVGGNTIYYINTAGEANFSALTTAGTTILGPTTVSSLVSNGAASIAGTFTMGGVPVISTTDNQILNITSNLNLANGVIDNVELANSSITINTSSGLTGGGTVALGGTLTLTGGGVLSIAGSDNQVNVSTPSGNVVLSLPQSIAASSSPTFNDLLISRYATVSSGLTVSSGFVSLPAGQIDNTELANSQVTVTAGTGLSGGGSISLGGTTTINLADTTVSANSYGSSGFTVPTFTVDAQGRLTAAGSYNISGLTTSNLSATAGILNSQLANSSITLNTNNTLLGGGIVSLGGTLNINLPQDLAATSSPTFDGLTVSAGAISSTEIATTGVIATSYGSSGMTVPTFTVNAQGQITTAGSYTISGLTNSNLSGTAGITNANLANSSIIVNTNGTLLGGATVSLGGSITLSLPQDLAATSSPTFNDLLISRYATVSSGLTVSSGFVSLPAGQIDNTELANSQVTVTAGTGLSGGGSISLGGTATINLADTTVSANSYGSSGFTVPTFTVDAQGRLTAAGSYNISGLTTSNLSATAGILNSQLANSSITIATGSGLLGGGTVALGGTVTLSLPQELAATSSPTFDGLTVSAGAISNTELANSTIGIFAGLGLIGGGNISLGGSTILELPQNVSATSSPTFNSLSLSQPLSTGNGGTGQSTYTAGDLVYSPTTNTLGKINIGSAGQVLTVSGGMPVWGSPASLSSWQENSNVVSPLNIVDDLAVGGIATASSKFQVSGSTGAVIKGVWNGTAISPVYGGTNQTSWNTGEMLYASDVNTLSKLSIGTPGQVLGIAAGVPSWITSSALNSWQENTGVISPLNITNDLAIGGTSTASALFQASGTTGLITTASVNSASIVNGSVTSTDLSTTGVSFGTYGASGFTVPTFNVDAAGRLVSAGSYNISGLTTSNLSASAGILNSQLANSDITINSGSGLTGGAVVALGGTITLNNSGVLSILGTNNQIIASTSSGNITLSLPQDIAASSSPTFTNLSLSGSATISGGLSLYGSPIIKSTDKQSLTLGDTNTGNIVIANPLITNSTINGQTISSASYFTGTASVSGLLSTSSIGSTENQTLTLGNSTTGNIILAPGGLTALTAIGSNISLGGSITSGTWNGDTIGASYGGTGITSYAIGDLIYASATNALSKLAAGATGNVLISGTTPSWGKVVLGTHTSGNYVSSVVGTSNQINVSSSTGDITLSLPQNISSTSIPTFAGMILNGTISLPNSNTLTGITNYTQFTNGIAVGGGTTYKINANGDTILSNLTISSLVNTGSASESGALTLYGTPTINTTSLQSLTLGDTNTGNIVIANPLIANSTLSLPNSNTLTGASGTVQFSAGITAGTSNLGATTVSSFIDNGSASVSGNLTLFGTPTIATTAMQDLTLGNGSTGNILTSNNIIASGTLTGLTGLTVSSGTVSLPAGQIDNTELAQSAVTVTAGTGLSGGGSVSLGGTTTLNLADTTVSANSYGSSGATVPTFTVDAQGRLTAASSYTISGLTTSNLSATAGILNTQLANSSITVNTGSGLSGGATVSLGGSLSLSNTGVLSITGTTNQISASASTGDITLSLPQDIHTSANPTFNNLSLSGSATVSGNFVLYNTPTIATTAKQTLTIGDTNTGNIAFGQNITSGVWNGTAISEVYGGTNQTSYTTGDLLYAANTNTLSKLNIGSTNQILSVTAGLPSWVNATSLSDWQVNSGVLAPLRITNDIAIGGIATSSAKFQIFGTTGNATTSGNLIFNTDGLIATTAKQTLTLGDTNTGNLSLGNFGTGVLHTNSLGTVSYGLVNLTSEITGTLASGNGGTGQSTWTKGDILYASAANTTAKLNIGATGQLLVADATGVPIWVDPSAVNTTNFWQRFANATALVNVGDDILIGGAASTSAKMRLTGSTGDLISSASATFAPTISGSSALTLRASTTTPGNILNVTNASGSSSLLSISSTGQLDTTGSVHLTSSATALVGTAVEGAWTMNGNTFTYRRTISVTNNDAVSTLPANHEITVTIPSSDSSQVYSKTLTNNNDFRIAYDTSEVPRNVSSYTSSNITFAFQLQASISPLATTSIYYIYYKNATLGAAPTHVSNIQLDSTDDYSLWTSSHAGYVLSQETTIKQEGTGSLKNVATTGNFPPVSTSGQSQLIASVSNHSSAVANVGNTNYVYGIGGQTSGTPTNAVYKSIVDGSGNTGTFTTTSQGQLPASLTGLEAVTAIESVNGGTGADGAIDLASGGSSGGCNGTNLSWNSGTSTCTILTDGSFSAHGNLASTTASSSKRVYVFPKGDGKFVIILNNGNTETNLYDPSNSTFSAGPAMTGNANNGHAIPKADGKYFIVLGNFNSTTNIYYPLTNSFSATESPSLSASASWGTHSFQRADGKYVIVLANSVDGTLTDIYDPSANTITAGPTLPYSAYNGSAHTFQRPDGNFVTIMANNTKNTAIYDATQSGTFSAGPQLTASADYGAHSFQRADGKFMVILSNSSDGTLTNIYDPSTNTFSAGPSLTTSVYATSLGSSHTFSRTDGKFVTVIGNSTATTNIYDPTKNAFFTGPSLTANAGAGANTFQRADGTYVTILGNSSTTTNSYNSPKVTFNFTTVDIPSGTTLTTSGTTFHTIKATGDVTIGGSINLDGKGYPGGSAASANSNVNGSGTGGGTGGNVCNTSGGGGGGAFGGAGGTGDSNGGAGGSTYNTDDLGSGGGAGSVFGGNGTVGGAGGGSIRIYTSRNITVNTISANGTAGTDTGSYCGGGGGSGGLISLKAGASITVTGSITANGGKGGNGSLSSGYDGGGGGGGGRIDFLDVDGTVSGTITASGGAGGTAAQSGGAGSSGVLTYTQLNKTIYALGGSTGTVQSTVYKSAINASGDIGTWSTASQSALLAARYNHTAHSLLVGFDTYIYVLGGNDGSSDQSTVWRSLIDNSSNVGTFTTTGQGQLPQALSNHGSTIIAVGSTNYIYVTGGKNGSTPQTTVYKASIDSSGNIGTFTATGQGQLPNSVYGHSMYSATVDGTGYIYISGGKNSSDTTINTVLRAPLDSSGNVGTWSAVAQTVLPQPLFQHTTKIITTGTTQYAYVLGGFGGSADSNTVYRGQLDPADMSSYIGTRTISSTDLTNKNALRFEIYSSKTGNFMNFEFSEDGTTWQSTAVTINSANTWETKTWDISGIATSARNAVTKLRFKNTSNTTPYTFYVDNVYALTSAFTGTAPTATNSGPAMGPVNLILNSQGSMPVRLNYDPTDLLAGTGGLNLYNGGATSVFSVDNTGNATLSGILNLPNSNILTGASGYVRFSGGATTVANVGVGMTAPAFKLDVTDSQASTISAMITNSNTATTAAALGLKLGFTGAGSTTNNFATFLNGLGAIQGKITSNGANGVTYATSGIDLAEYFTKQDINATYSAGMVVCQDVAGVAPCNNLTADKIIGVVSEAPAFLGGTDGPDKVAVGLIGQIPVQIATSSAAISSGDLLTPTANGQATKATTGQPIVGRALAYWTPGSDQSTVLTLVSPMASVSSENLWASTGGKLISNLPVQVPELTITGKLKVGLLTIDDLESTISSLTGEIKIKGDLAVEKSIKVLGASAGKTTIPMGSTLISITSSLVSTSSAIFATPVDTPTPISTQSTQSGEFVIRIPVALPNDLTVNWWIVN